MACANNRLCHGGHYTLPQAARYPASGNSDQHATILRLDTDGTGEARTVLNRDFSREARKRTFTPNVYQRDMPIPYWLREIRMYGHFSDFNNASPGAAQVMK
jgi:hypothetical protein